MGRMLSFLVTLTLLMTLAVQMQIANALVCYNCFGLEPCTPVPPTKGQKGHSDAIHCENPGGDAVCAQSIDLKNEKQGGTRPVTRSCRVFSPFVNDCMYRSGDIIFFLCRSDNCNNKPYKELIDQWNKKDPKEVKDFKDCV